MTTFRNCRYCGDIHDTANWPDNHRDPAPARSDLPAPSVRGDLPAYKSPLGTGVIEGRAARREDLARSDCRPVDPSEFKPLAPVKPRAKWLKQHGQPAAS